MWEVRWMVLKLREHITALKEGGRAHSLHAPEVSLSTSSLSAGVGVHVLIVMFVLLSFIGGLELDLVWIYRGGNSELAEVWLPQGWHSLALSSPFSPRSVILHSVFFYSLSCVSARKVFFGGFRSSLEQLGWLSPGWLQCMRMAPDLPRSLSLVSLDQISHTWIHLFLCNGGSLFRCGGATSLSREGGADAFGGIWIR